MKPWTAQLIWWLAFFGMMILFAGDPDLMDAIIQRVSKG